VAKKIGADRKRSTANLPSALGAELTDRRTKAGWTQQALADRLGYDVKYIGQVEQAEKSPTLTTLISFATAFDTRLSELLKSAEKRIRQPQKTAKQVSRTTRP
jgi:transcriptional regulator with XRE-family HTH domain